MPEEKEPVGALAFEGIPMPHFYSNSFSVSMSATEISSVFLLGSRPAAVVSLPFSLAKSYARTLQNMVSEYEKKTGVPVEYAEDLFSKMK